MIEYEPFVREGSLVTPYWKTWKPGEKAYDVSTDSLYECIEEDFRLEAKSEKTDEPDRGMTPRQIGFPDGFEPLPLHVSPRWRQVVRVMAPFLLKPETEVIQLQPKPLSVVECGPDGEILRRSEQPQDVVQALDQLLDSLREIRDRYASQIESPQSGQT